MKKHKIRTALVLAVVIIIGVVVYRASQHAETYVKVEESQPTVEFGDEKKLEAIRSRADIKKQQELIVQETYLLEEKEQMTREKEAAIKKFDADLATLESKLEGVRAAKTSFQ